MELLERFAQGELEAFETLFRQFQGEVYGWIVRIVRDPSAAEELTVETFWRIYRSHARFDPARSFGAWARRIATNVALDRLKSTRREVTLASDPSQGPIQDPAVGRDVREKIASAFRQLPRRLQVVAVLALIEERPYPEIAEALGISLGAVKSRVFRAVRQLQEKLKRQGIEP
ncbi:MAG TPA: RNA polymerase sigma factor [Candidatus Acidoferrales bacterium]|nr:RNA polymerase sigma factor [Candidatus Acidoferrales bacterium]